VQTKMMTTLPSCPHAQIALAVQRYWWATNDAIWLRDEGGALLQGIARFWASRVDADGSIRNVVSMDERTCNMGPRHVSNAVYTNALARLSLTFANDVNRACTLPCITAFLLCSNAMVTRRFCINYRSTYRMHHITRCART
jgi:trehalose/maltose hydrolase-like predicted phosphorylase